MSTPNVVARENIKNWDPESQKLYLFRRAIEEMQKVSEASTMDERGYQWEAGVHGGFGGQPYCQHGNLNFITWHRPYVLDLELKLRDQIRQIAGGPAADAWRLPYWDWAAADVAGLPEAFTVSTYDDLNTGATRPNPLLSQPYQLEWDPGLEDAPSPPPPWPTRTYRIPRSLEQLEALRPRVLQALKESDFSTFSRVIEGPHNSLHVWVMGYMATFRSAFDPLFWVHHCNIDRQLWTWQRSFGNSSIPQSVRIFPCQPFRFVDIRAEAFFDTEELGYIYAESQSTTTRASAVAAMKARFEATLSAGVLDATGVAPPPPKTLDVDLEPPPHDFERAYLRFHDLERTEKSYEIRVFVQGATPDVDTPLTSAHHYLGSYVILGHGNCPGAPGHCDRKALTADGLRQEHHLAPGDALIDVTENVRTVIAQRSMGGPLSVAILVVDMRQRQVEHERIRFARLSLTTT